MSYIFLDESGFTGSDLLSQEQQTFAVASICIEPATAEAIAAEVQPSRQAKELKHSNLVRRPAGREVIKGFLKRLSSEGIRTKIHVIHKQYACVGKVVDHVIEPAIYLDGHNLYADGMNIGLANLLFFSIPAVYGKSVLAELLRLFQEFCRRIDMQSLEAFYGYVARIRRLGPTENSFPLDLILYGIDRCGDEDVIRRMPKGALDLALSSAFQLVSWWRSEIDGEMIVVHDASANMSRRKDVWDALTGDGLGPFDVASTAGKHRFPVMVDETRFVPSEQSAGIQLADLLAGAAACLRNAALPQAYRQQIAELLEPFPVFALLPSPEVVPEKLGTKGMDGNVLLEQLTLLAERLGLERW